MVVAEHACDRCTNEKFCLECYQTVHAPPVMQRHQQLSIGENLQEPVPCRIHQDEKLKYWCCRCNLLSCPDCVLLEHKDHPYVLINGEAKEFEIKVNIIVICGKIGSYDVLFYYLDKDSVRSYPIICRV
jgi:hypothetical protein